ncbi:MAG: 4-amino-4-deoxy-L-arabinose transferase and related glycosyltransferase of family, partial [Pedosphaera sp.]|nr:4-amino-4-deoxy-L-arabinose transferase and related glycosyltransferase of family [Pedosphaera sp.]
ILSLAYAAFRMAWGRLGAFVAAAVFISVFSFSHLTSICNYNFATPYTHESTHGILLLLATALIAVRWSRQKSRKLAFALGICGGLAVVMKPEFMLAGGVVGIAALALRWWQRQWVGAAEFGLLLAGLALPTVAFAAWFARVESWKAAFIDASQAWWLVLVEQIQKGSNDQQTYVGLDQPWVNVRFELEAGAIALVALVAIWAAGWFLNRSWSWTVRGVAALGAAAVVCCCRLPGGWFWVGGCLPVLTGIVLALVGMRLWRELRQTGRPTERTVMAFALTLLAGAMLARMLLHTRVYHLGFFQAALASMVVVAMMVSELPRWTGVGLWGQRVATIGCVLVLAVGCASIAAKSRAILFEQTEVVGTGRDRFYAFNGLVDETGPVVNWVVEQLKSIPPEATLAVLPDGEMINYLSRHVNPVPARPRGSGEKEYLELLKKSPPDYMVLICRDPRQYGVTRYGTVGNSGRSIVNWLAENYTITFAAGGDPLVPEQMKAGATIVRRKGIGP